jgi:deoxycytidylate deaminase
MFAAQMNKDPHGRVGASIVSKDGNNIHLSHNGFPDEEENWKRPEKYSYVIHAEVYALIRCPFDKKGSTLYCTLRPCLNCLKHSLSAGIENIIYIIPEVPDKDVKAVDEEYYNKLIIDTPSLNHFEGYTIEEVLNEAEIEQYRNFFVHGGYRK